MPEESGYSSGDVTNVTHEIKNWARDSNYKSGQNPPEGEFSSDFKGGRHTEKVRGECSYRDDNERI